MNQYFSQTTTYFDPERHSKFQRIRHGYNDESQGELFPESGQDDPDLELSCASAHSPRTSESIDDSSEEVFISARSRPATDSSIPERSAPTEEGQHDGDDEDTHQTGSNQHDENEPVPAREKSGASIEGDIPDFTGPTTVYADSKELWRLHMMLIEATPSEDIKTRNRLLTQMNRDLLSQLDSQDQDLMQLSAQLRAMTRRVARLQKSNNRRRAEEKYLYEVAVDLNERLDDSERQRQQLLSDQSNIRTTPAIHEQGHFDQLRRILEQQRHKILQLQSESLDKDQEIKDLTYFLEMAVQSQNDLSFELNELLSRASSARETWSFQPPLPEEADGPTTITSTARRYPSETEVLSSVISGYAPTTSSRGFDTSTEQDAAELRRMIGRMHEAERNLIFIDQGMQVEQRELAYPPTNIGSHVQHYRFVMVGTYINIEPDIDVQHPPTRGILEAAALLVRQSLADETGILTPLKAPRSVMIQPHFSDDTDRASQDLRQETSVSLEERQWALMQGRDTISTSHSLTSLIRSTDSQTADVEAGGDLVQSVSGSLPFYTRRVSPSSFVRRIDPSTQHDRAMGISHESHDASLQPRLIGLPFEAPGRRRTATMPHHSHGIQDIGTTDPPPSRIGISHWNLTAIDPALSNLSESPNSLSVRSTSSPHTPEVRLQSAIINRSSLFDDPQIRQELYKQIYDSIERDSVNAPHQSQLICDIEKFVSGQPSSPNEQDRRLVETNRLQALRALEGVIEGREVHPHSISCDHTTKVKQKSSDREGSSSSHGKFIAELERMSYGPKSPIHRRPDPPRVPVVESNNPESQAIDSTSSESLRSTASTSDQDSQGTGSSKSRYFYVRIDDRDVAIPMSLSELWSAIRPKLPSYYIWYLCIPYLATLFYLGYITWISKEEWYEQNRGQIRLDVMERRDLSWQFDGGSRIGKIIETVFDRVYQPLPRGSYA